MFQLSKEEEDYLIDKIQQWFEVMNDQTPQQLVNAGFLFPTQPPAIWETLPDEWDNLMDNGGIYNLSGVQIEEYLEKWNRLLGYAYWVHALWGDRLNALSRCLEFVKDYVFAKAEGGREQKAAIAGSYWLTAEVIGKVNEAERKHTELGGLIRKWEKIDFSISRTITSRQNRM